MDALTSELTLLLQEKETLEKGREEFLQNIAKMNMESKLQQTQLDEQTKVLICSLSNIYSRMTVAVEQFIVFLFHS